MNADTGKIPRGELALVTELPADLLRRRPDVRVAERQLAAQSALIGVAESELYPSITLLVPWASALPAGRAAPSPGPPGHR